MFYKKFTNGMMDSNVYLIADEGEAAIIDCGVPTESVLRALNENELKLKYIILTHCHVDHIAFLAELKEATGAKVCIGEGDAKGLVDEDINLYRMCGLVASHDQADILLNNSSELAIGKIKISIFETPGHTEGGICIYCKEKEEHLFTGDTLFKLSIGRTDFRGGSSFKLKASIDKLFRQFSETTIVHPGHGDNTTIGYEFRHNPYKDYLL